MSDFFFFFWKVRQYSDLTAEFWAVFFALSSFSKEAKTHPSDPYQEAIQFIQDVLGHIFSDFAPYMANTEVWRDVLVK